MPTVANAVGVMERLAAAYRQLGAARPGRTPPRALILQARAARRRLPLGPDSPPLQEAPGSASDEAIEPRLRRQLVTRPPSCAYSRRKSALVRVWFVASGY